MRRILIDRARKRSTCKHGGDRQEVSLAEDEVQQPPDNEEKLIALDRALSAFETCDATKAQYVKLRYFVGLTNREASQAIGVSPATGDRYWVFSKAWLQNALERIE